MKTVKLIKDRGGDKAGGRITVPDATADDLIAKGVATADAVEAPKAAPVPVVAPTVPQSEYDALKAKYDDLAKSAAELDAENKELADENKKLREQLAAHPLEPVKKK